MDTTMLLVMAAACACFVSVIASVVLAVLANQKKWWPFNETEEDPSETPSPIPGSSDAIDPSASVSPDGCPAPSFAPGVTQPGGAPATPPGDANADIATDTSKWMKVGDLQDNPQGLTAAEGVDVDKSNGYGDGDGTVPKFAEGRVSEGYFLGTTGPHDSDEKYMETCYKLDGGKDNGSGPMCTHMNMNSETDVAYMYDNRKRGDKPTFLWSTHNRSLWVSPHGENYMQALEAKGRVRGKMDDTNKVGENKHAKVQLTGGKMEVTMFDDDWD